MPMTSLPPLAPITSVNVLAYGAKGDDNGVTATDDRVAIATAIATAQSLGLQVYFPQRKYYTSKYIDIANAYKLRIVGHNAQIRYQSADTSVVHDTVALSDNAARCAILLRNCQHVEIEGLSFKGQESIYTDLQNLGPAVYQQRSRFTKLIRCKSDYGRSLFMSDANKHTNGSIASLSVSSGVVTLTATSGVFVAGHVGCSIWLAGCTNQANNIIATVTGYISTTQVTLANTYGVAQAAAAGRFVVQDGEYGTVLDHCDSYRSRGHITLPNGSEMIGGTYRWPTESSDLTGVGDFLKFDPTTNTVTLTDNIGRFQPCHQGKYIKIQNATTSANNGVFQITYVSATQISFTNASGVTEVYPGNWWLINGDKIGHGAGTGSVSVSGGVVTFTSAEAIFGPEDNGKSILLREASNSGNLNAHNAVTYVSSTVVTFPNSIAVNENYSGLWTLDGWDSTGGSGTIAGSGHGVYIFAANDWEGRSQISFQGVKFEGNRTACLKFSGSATPIRNIVVNGCQAKNCNAFIVFGADDAQEHSAVTITNNVLIDCGQVHRRGQYSNETIAILGARSVKISNNTFHFTREAVQAQIGGLAGLAIVDIERYDVGISQPVEHVDVSNNFFTFDVASVRGAQYIVDSSIVLKHVGRREKYASAGALTKQSTTNTMTIVASAGTITRATGSWITDSYRVGGPIILSNFVNGGNNVTKTIASMTATVITVTSNTGLVDETKVAALASNGVMTLTHGNAAFLSGEDAGKTLQIVNMTDAGNNGSFTIESVPTTTSVTYLNAAGVADTSLASHGGTYRIYPKFGTAMCKVDRNQIAVGSTGISCTSCVTPEISENQFFDLSQDVHLIDCASPSVHDNTTFMGDPAGGGGGVRPRLWCESGCSWPRVWDNSSSIAVFGGAPLRAWDYSQDNSTRLDFPLLGKRVRCTATQGKEEIVFAYGSGHVDGDFITIKGVTCTYKTTSPGANQFNSVASLLTLLNAISGVTAADYGADFSPAITTNHIRVRATAVTTSDATWQVFTSTLSPSALVYLHNDTVSTNVFGKSVGSASTGPVPDKIAVWSPFNSMGGALVVLPANADARTLIQANGPALPVKVTTNSGAVEILNVGDCTGKVPEFRVVIH